MDIIYLKQSTFEDRPPQGVIGHVKAYWKCGWIQTAILATAVGLATLYALFVEV